MARDAKVKKWLLSKEQMWGTFRKISSKHEAKRITVKSFLQIPKIKDGVSEYRVVSHEAL